MNSTSKDRKIQSVDIHEIAETMRPVETAVSSEFMTLEIEGMMCGHCEKMVKKALEKMPQIDEATTDFQEGTAVISVNEDVSEEELKVVIEKAGYELIGIK